MKALLLFDIDGTILRLRDGRSRIIFADAVREIFGKEVHPDQLPNFAGMTDLQILKELSATINIPFRKMTENIDYIWDKLLDVFRNYCNKEHIEILPGVIDLIEHFNTVKDVKLGLVTGNFRANAYLKLSAWDLDKYFSTGAFGCDFRNRNKLPLLAIRRSNKDHGKRVFNYRNALIIGDGPRDLECAKTNSIKVCCVATGGIPANKLEHLGPDLLFESFGKWNEVSDSIMNLMQISR